jgi:hypothetical protein
MPATNSKFANLENEKMIKVIGNISEFCDE